MKINPYTFYKTLEFSIDERFKTLGKALLAIATLVSTTVILYKFFKKQDDTPITKSKDKKPPIQEALDPDALLAQIKEHPEAAENLNPALKQDKNFALKALQVNPEVFHYFDEAIQKDEVIILGYIHSPALDLTTSKNELFMKYFFLSSKLKPFFGNLNVMNACLILIDKMGEEQRNSFYEGLLIDLERNKSPLLDDATFMHAVRNRNPELTPEYSHLPTMTTISPKQKTSHPLSKLRQKTKAHI